MRRHRWLVTFAIVFALGYGTCWIHHGSQTLVKATQEATGVDALTTDTLVEHKRFTSAASDFSGALVAEGTYTSGSEGQNYFALSVGGIDVIRDLEDSRGVDPETFAAIYADRASPEVSQHLDQDDSGRWRYKGTVIRMYSRERLREIFQQRDRLEIRSRRVTN